MPGKNPPDKRDYDHEYALWKKRPHTMDIQYARVKARRAMTKEYGKDKLVGKDIDHITPLRDKADGGGRSNWRVSSERANRNWRKGKKGYD
jgi:hypothetical protein